MAGWRAVVPIKQGHLGKSRLAPLFAAEERDRIVHRMARHVLATLSGVAALDTVTVLSPRPFAGWDGPWHRDLGRGLNAELAAWRAERGDARIVVIHADLPMLGAGDVAMLVQMAAARGMALAHDRAGAGTNAVAIADGRDFEFCFGADSCQRHLAQDPGMGIVARAGLMDDIDTPADVTAFCALGGAI